MVLAFFSSNSHSNACVRKQSERQSAIDTLPPVYKTPLSSPEEKIHALSVAQLVSNCKSGDLAPSEVMLVYAKKTIAAHATTNCVTDFMFEEALAIPSVVNWPHSMDPETSDASDLTQDRSLLGVPVSVKDTVDIAGHDTTIGYSRNVGHPATTTSPIVRLLRDAGALVHVKTTVPTGLIALETTSDLFGLTSNPYKKTHTAGGSTGGGAALLACGGSKIEIGTDLGGSVRIPAHFCGIWSLKGSVGRFPSWGSVSSMPGLEGVQIVASPMAGNLADLEEFWKRVVEAKPWQYDHTARSLLLRLANVPFSWWLTRFANKDMKWLNCKDTPPDVFHGLKIAYQLLFGDGGAQLRNWLSPHETITKASAATLDLLALPRVVKRLMGYFARKSDPTNADLLDVLHAKSVVDVRYLVAQREAYRAAWFDKWTESGLDFVLTVPHPFPAFKNGESEKVNLMTTGFTAIFNLLDYTAGVLPVTFVDKEIDGLPADFKASAAYASMGGVAKEAYSAYDVDGMHGLPMGVQVLGRRLEEERVLEGMNIIEDALRQQGTVFVSQVKV
ncbi:hypothetical protein H0H81_004249 [Sphagnurus paluster]|uniref:Amidase domain-containing protein n=1 Tax=Sphagnurus paluster TaxID=117069 RepID=A0A9P7GL42_9AGAR|nr:hypothetical protein H0H81_004249 [Sphagnurus paluster]